MDPKLMRDVEFALYGKLTSTNHHQDRLIKNVSSRSELNYNRQNDSADSGKRFKSEKSNSSNRQHIRQNVSKFKLVNQLKLFKS